MSNLKKCELSCPLRKPGDSSKCLQTHFKKRSKYFLPFCSIKVSSGLTQKNLELHVQTPISLFQNYACRIVHIFLDKDDSSVLRV